MFCTGLEKAARKTGGVFQACLRRLFKPVKTNVLLLKGEAMKAILNPGSAPVKNASYEDAERNLFQLIQEAGLIRNTLTIKSSCEEDNGRFLFVINNADVTCSVKMPGIPLEQVRFVNDPGQNIWNYPRLYINSSSWVWCYAVSQVAEAFAA